MMTSAYLLEEAMSSKDDVSNISRQLSGIRDDDISSDVITINRKLQYIQQEATVISN
ncbi:scarecrow-like protein 32 [Dorcoceras hygrometricum]|uniref:Scarecrow-like protein 32 n=1 Tax=Dorcoceras hygrometricum TaxID=472368 RepID=A0A2Z6ZR80_9LAMI|nr:scarecrow-like protein 32 [Dorcoceras hygrometricum]